MTYYYRVSKDGWTYKTTSKLYMDIAVKLKGYTKMTRTTPLWIAYSNAKLLPFKFTKLERDKYKVLLRLMK